MIDLVKVSDPPRITLVINGLAVVPAPAKKDLRGELTHSGSASSSFLTVIWIIHKTFMYFSSLVGNVTSSVIPNLWLSNSSGGEGRRNGLVVHCK